jgi:hypothetical protein
MAHPLLDDAFAASAIDEAMRELDAALEPDDRAWLREELALLLEHDPYLREAFAGARPHQVAHSDVRVAGATEGGAMGGGVVEPEGTGTAGR